MINYYDQKRFEIYEEWGKQYPEASLPSNLQAPSSTTAPNPDATLQKPPTVVKSPAEPEPTPQPAPQKSTKEIIPPLQGVKADLSAPPDPPSPSPALKSTTPSGPQPTPQPVAQEPSKETTPAPVTLQEEDTAKSGMEPKSFAPNSNNFHNMVFDLLKSKFDSAKKYGDDFGADSVSSALENDLLHVDECISEIEPKIEGLMQKAKDFDEFNTTKASIQDSYNQKIKPLDKKKNKSAILKLAEDTLEW